MKTEKGKGNRLRNEKGTLREGEGRKRGGRAWGGGHSGSREKRGGEKKYFLLIEEREVICLIK